MTPESTQAQPEQALGHLIVLRTTLAAVLRNLDAAIALLSGSEGTPDEAPAADCKHPEREILTGLGEKPRWRCKNCGVEFSEEASW